MVAHPVAELVTPDWAEALTGVEPRIHEMGDFLRAETAAGRGFLPHGDRILRAFSRPMADVRVLIVGQDPYPTPGHPVGLSFSVERDVRPLPRSLQNIYTELQSDLGIAPCEHGDLTGWFEQGVLLLNRCLTVQPGRPASHRGKVPIVKSSHPSPMSARYGFFGSRPFSRTNELLVQQGADPINWDLSSH